LPVREVAYRATEPVGADALRDIADALYGPLPGTDPAEAPAHRELVRVDSEGEEYVLRMALPLASKAAVDAVRAGDDLVLTVVGHRRVFTLPSVLRRCEVVGGSFEDGELRVRFRPDPALWPAAAPRGRHARSEDDDD
jgi:arsenite-transporting ATPase